MNKPNIQRLEEVLQSLNVQNYDWKYDQQYSAGKCYYLAWFYLGEQCYGATTGGHPTQKQAKEEAATYALPRVKSAFGLAP